MSLRRATPADAPAIAALTRAAYAKWVEVIGREPLPMQADYDEALLRHRFDLWEDKGALRALIETTPDGDHLLIVNLAVAPDAQGLGLGSRLLDHAEALATEMGLSGLRLYTNRLIVANVAYYNRRGFVVEREAPLNGGVAVYMTKPISARA
jgi:ribosomal protein S18 acetylase RimI-like enzyme